MCLFHRRFLYQLLYIANITTSFIDIVSICEDIIICLNTKERAVVKTKSEGNSYICNTMSFFAVISIKATIHKQAQYLFIIAFVSSPTHHPHKYA